MREHPNSLDKVDLMMAAASSSIAGVSKERYLARIGLIERALAIDPDYVRALKASANSHAGLVWDGFSSDPDADLAKAMKASDRALELAPNDIDALATKAYVLHTQRDFDGAAALIRKVIELQPQNGWMIRQLGQIAMEQGHYKEALENFLTAAKLLPETEPRAAVGTGTGSGARSSVKGAQRRHCRV
jgi:tetratricopeptide (TPR) repeat protein